MKYFVILAFLLFSSVTLKSQEFSYFLQSQKKKFHTPNFLNNSKGNVKLDSMVQFSKVETGYQPYSRVSFKYNDQGGLVEHVEARYISSQEVMETDNKKLYRYNDDSKLIAKIKYNWNSALEEWLKYDSTSFVYNEGVVSETYYLWSGNNQEYLPNMNSKYYLHTDSLYDSIITSYWINDEFAEYKKEIYGFQNDQYSELIIYTKEEGDWRYDDKTIYTWDGDKIVEKIEQDYNDNDSVFVDEIKYSYVWQPNGNLLEEVDYIWVSYSETWKEIYKLDAAYDNSVTNSDLVLPLAYFNDQDYDPSIYFAHKVDSLFNYQPVISEELEEVGVLNFYYSNNVGISEEVDKDFSVRVFPNPVDEILNIDFDGAGQIGILDISGRLIANKVFKGRSQINVSNLIAGIYFVKITANSGTESVLKFLKQ
jgi:hypothetical protein